MLADPNRPKSDKASILIDTIQTLKDLMTQVDRLKAEHVTLSQESREVLMMINLTSPTLLLLLVSTWFHHLSLVLNAANSREERAERGENIS